MVITQESLYHNDLHHHSVLLTCMVLYAEGLDLYYDNAIFVIERKCFGACTSSTQRQRVRYVECYNYCKSETMKITTLFSHLKAIKLPTQTLYEDWVDWEVVKSGTQIWNRLLKGHHIRKLVEALFQAFPGILVSFELYIKAEEDEEVSNWLLTTKLNVTFGKC